MIQRIFIDNYKCFTNFECRFDAMQLLLGDNGSGKTFIFDVLDALRAFITAGVPSNKIFPFSTSDRMGYSSLCRRSNWGSTAMADITSTGSSLSTTG